MNLTSRNVLFSSGIILFPFASSVSQNIKEVENNQPNVIFILADDLGIGDLGCYGQKIIKTPTIDRLASEGMIFSQHYSGTTVSAPSRCSLLTGKNTGHTYVRGNKGYKNADGREYDTPLPTTEITVAEIFKQKNYKTACFGKWGLGGPNTEGSPVNQGFDYFFGYLGQGDAHKSFPKLLFENNKPVVLNGKVYAHDTIMAKALQYINTNAKAPFFIYLTPTIPHAELAVPTGEMMGYEGKFPEVPFAGKGSYGAQAEPKATYAAMVSRLDRDIQRLVDLLKQKGILNNTLIIFTSDNGAHKEGGNDPDFFDSNGPYRGYKRDLYEGGIRAPFIAYWPNVIQSGSKSSHVSAFWDFLPTVCDLIHVAVPKGIDGLSFLPTFTGKAIQNKHESLYFEFHEQGGKQAIIKDGWKLLHFNVNNPAKFQVELYHFSEDIGEQNNVAAKFPQKVEELTKLLKNQRTESDLWNFTKEK